MAENQDNVKRNTVNSSPNSSKKKKRRKSKKQIRKITKGIIAFNIIVTVVMAIYLTCFLIGNNKRDEIVVSENSVSEEQIVEEIPRITEEEFIASWASLDSDLSTAKVGDVVTFGRYEQDSISENFLEPIEWDVLAVSGNAVLLISHNIIDEQPYHSTLEYITWEACTLRSWLNKDFMDNAFNQEEKAKLKSVKLENPDSFEFYEPFYAGYNMKCGATGGNETEDKVFLLSYPELIEYYNLSPAEDFIGYVSEDLKAEATPATKMSERGYSNWWLRSPADNFQFAMYISEDYLQCISGSVDDGTVGIRPVVWVNY